MAEKEKLGIQERFLLLSMIPSEGNMIELMMFKDIKEKISLSKTEIEQCEFKIMENGMATWNAEKYKGKDITFSESEKQFFKTALLKLNEDKKLTEDHISIYKEFVR